MVWKMDTACYNSKVRDLTATGGESQKVMPMRAAFST